MIINNWGKSKEESLLSNKINNIYNNGGKSRNSVSVDYENDIFNSLSQEEKAKEDSKPQSRLGKRRDSKGC